MREMRLPPPVADIETIANDEFLSELSTSIDALAGSPVHLLQQLVVASLTQETPISEVTSKLAKLHFPGHVGGRKSKGSYRLVSPFNQYLQERIVPAELVTQRIVFESSAEVKMVRPTDRARESLGVIGVLAAMQHTHSFPIGAMIGKRVGRPIKNSSYPYTPTLRLRLMQAMVGEGAFISTMTPLVGRTPDQLESVLQYLKDDGLVVAVARNNETRTRYRLSDEVQPFVAELLCALASLKQATYSNRARKAASVLLNPEAGPPLVNEFMARWNQRTFSRPMIDSLHTRGRALPDTEGRWVDELIAHHVAEPDNRPAVKMRVERLVAQGIVAQSDNSPQGEPTLQLHPGIVLALNPMERRLLARGYGIEGMVFGDLAPLDRRHLEGRARQAGYDSIETYIRDGLLPKVKRIVQSL